jgi:hypothetical protein
MFLEAELWWERVPEREIWAKVGDGGCRIVGDFWSAHLFSSFDPLEEHVSASPPGGS